MKYKRCFLPYLLLTSALVTASALGDETSGSPAEIAKATETANAAALAKEEAERRERFLKLDVASLETSPAIRRVGLSTCIGVFTIDQILSGNPHLNFGAKFWILGPIPFLDAYVVSPRQSAAKNTWTGGNYKALPDPLVPNWQSIDKVPVEVPESHPQGAHSYHLRVTSWDSDDCPQYIQLWHGKHSGTSIVMDDPGHAGATRD